MPVAYIGIGSNVGDKQENCRKAIELLASAGRVVRSSSFYCTEPVGPSQDDFVNAVVALDTELSPLALLARCHVIEDELGRRRVLHWGPRTLDLDILLYGDQVVETAELKIPHPEFSRRGFVLIPFCEIGPQVVHPVLRKTADQLRQELDNAYRVTVCDRAGDDR